MLYALGALVSLIIAIFCFYWMQTDSETNSLLLIAGFLFGILTIVFGGLFLSGRINKTDEIHITE